jgi:AraC family transcriptional regulator
MSDSLKTGQFYGKAKRSVEIGGIVLTELIHRVGRKLPRHTHESAYFGLLLGGSYSERCTQRNADYGPFTIGFHPPALTHSDEVGNCGSRMFCIELRHSFLAQTRPFLTAPEFVPDLCASEVTWLGLRLFRDFAGETLSRLQVEELCSDMLERVGCIAPGCRPTDSVWLKRALDLLHGSYRAPLTLEDVARQIEIHPIHLSRVFRKRYRCTMAEYMNRLRVQFVCRALESGWADLAGLATDAGFADQSHMGRVFKQLTCQTPGQFRRFLYSQIPAA